MMCQANSIDQLAVRTLLLERLDDVFQFLARGECVLTCFPASHLHRAPLYPDRRGPAGPGRWLDLRLSYLAR